MSRFYGSLCIMSGILADFLMENDCKHRMVVDHIQQLSLSDYFCEYFGDDDSSMFDWI